MKISEDEKEEKIKDFWEKLDDFEGICEKVGSFKYVSRVVREIKNNLINESKMFLC